MLDFAGIPFGSWFEGLGAVGAIVAAGVSLGALRTARAANATADQARRDARTFADEARVREESREHASIARQLQAWWVVWHEGRKKCFGVYVTNAGQGATVFRGVRIETRGNSNARGAGGAITFTSLPPGSYVLRSTDAGSPKPWAEPEVARSALAYEPLLYAERYAVTSITFEDPMKQAWCWTPERGLEQLTGTPSVGDGSGVQAGV
ncbi:hypothetical protein KZC56_06505 [Microbacterium sp. SSW1-47]|uniref:hypothetical protein n=1 Tax=Microbacterium TaxID=33882 RepID=UPI00109B7494|nr:MULTISPECIES: hypothetical protein [Microbacterium]MCK2025947.1 hypothetical protein [Microbacterium sufflavum]